MKKSGEAGCCFGGRQYGFFDCTRFEVNYRLAWMEEWGERERNRGRESAAKWDQGRRFGSNPRCFLSGVGV